MSIKQFKDDVLDVAKKNGSEMAFLSHAAKVLLSVYEESATLLESTGLVDTKAYIKLIDKELAAQRNNSKGEADSVTLSPSVDAIIRGAVLAAGTSANVTELHILIEFICAVIENESEELALLSRVCENPLDLRIQLKAILGGETIENLESDDMNASAIKGYEEFAAPIEDNFCGDRSAIDQIISATNRAGGSIITLVGEKRSGKSAVMESFAYWLHNTESTKTKQKIIELDTSTLIRTSIHRGVLEQYLAAALYDCVEDKAILYIDNIHYINDACRDPAFMPFLANAADKGVTIICSITPDAYSLVFDQRGYSNTVTRIDVKPAVKEHRCDILRIVADKLSNEHFIVFDDDAIQELNNLADDHFRTNTLGSCIETLERSISIHDNDLVTKTVIQEAVSAVKGIELNVITTSFGNKLKDLASSVKKELFGQDEAINEICEQIQLANLGFKIREKQPRGAFMMLGSSGVGKTETTEVIARELGLKSLVINCGELQESHTISKLLGAPPGYIGHDKGDGLLAEFVIKNPTGVVVFDEIEKASPRIFDLLLGVLDKGSLTTNTQKELDFSKNTLFFTSNCGASEVGNSSFGLLNNKVEKEAVDRTTFERLFRPEFRNRLTAIIDFKTLSTDDVVQITLKSVNKLINRTMNQYGMKVTVDSKTLNFISDKYYSKEMGARPIERGVETEIGKRIGGLIMNSLENLPTKVNFTVKGGELTVASK
ncbi:AAA family ATPase [Vibrio coralliirubri]|uniref:AAA family ATPase n=1 Tax=Vibrio coralliirubri TaxID=1516159 RepID=UPI0022833351|nr:AAA family ATPase [Vibrio coralliirubri]MCY9861031.1 AAA family ATPase [Vibrio coralliirubri]